MVSDGSGANSFCVALCTAAPGDADRIARALVEEKLAACVNIAPVVLPITSGYQPYLDWISQSVG